MCGLLKLAPLTVDHSYKNTTDTPAGWSEWFALWGNSVYAGFEGLGLPLCRYYNYTINNNGVLEDYNVRTGAVFSKIVTL